jgi:hypothetical protein
MADVTLGIMDRLEEIGDARGAFERLGARHAALFIDESPKVLLVTFERMDIMALRGTSVPLGLGIVDRHGWSLMSLLSKSETGWRDAAIYGYLDRLVDEGFFEDFDRVVFYGSGLAGYAAATFSVAAPGSTVVALAPRATLDVGRTRWDARHKRLRRADFSARYGYAPDMLEAASEAFLIHDPWEIEDAMHASLFRAEHIQTIGFRGIGPDPESTLRATMTLTPLIEAACEGRLSVTHAAQLWRARRSHAPWQRLLLERAEERGGEELIKQLCRYVVARSNSRRFSRRLAELEAGIRPGGIALG